MKTDDAVAGLELANAAAGFDDGAGELVAENLRRMDEAVLNFLDVRAADAAGSHAEKNLTLADLRNRYGFDHDAALAAINAGAHLARTQRPAGSGLRAHAITISVLY